MVTDDKRAHLAHLILAFRRIRPEELPCGLFAETGWEMMLELFLADAKGMRITGREICERNNARPNIASRWLQHLSAEKLVVGDGDGDLDDALVLSPTGLEQMERLLDKALSLSEELKVLR